LTFHHAEPQTAIGQALHISDYLVYISVIPTLLLAGFLGGSVVAKLMNNDVMSKFLAGLAVMIGGYFLGAIGGQVYMLATEGGTGGSHAAVQPLLLHAATSSLIQDHESDETGDEHADKTAGDQAANEHDEADHDKTHDHGAGEHAGEDHEEEDPNAKLDRDVGTFFSIYYCLTGLHAIHIIGGIIALSWIFWRSLLGHWRSDYFGPVDYVGLYWHLVDLIWIFLFPLLYLID
jgi:cytochrome c oxidase subunit 3